MTMCTVKEIQEAIREDCRSQHDMDSTDIDRVMQTLPFAQEETGKTPPLINSYNERKGMTMCTVKEIQEAIREDCKSQHDMDSTDIDRVMQTLPFA